MSELFTITENILEQAENTALLGLETNTKLIKFKIDLFNIIIELITEKNAEYPFQKYDEYYWIVRKNISWLEEELDAHEPGVQRLLLRLAENKEDEQYLMNCHLRITEHIKRWNKDYEQYVSKRLQIESGEINVLDTFKCLESLEKKKK